MASSIEGLQRLGRALMLPIAVLPVASMLLRLGQPDLLNIPVLAAAGDAIFANLGLVFAVGVAVGFARENHGAAGLASLVGFLVATHGAESLLSIPGSVTAGLDSAAAAAAATAWRVQQLSKLSMPVGILSGLIAGYAYNRFSEIRLPDYLAFFGGRRFVPIVTGCFGLVVALAFGFAWPLLARGMDGLSMAVVGAGS
ncbi:MAG: PTS transporter subunit EIIC, partial [Gammaproteobacteria bacterium]|nr:PTS transporter subunit EIIC [Gammaproteobacteria bacterium]